MPKKSDDTPKKSGDININIVINGVPLVKRITTAVAINVTITFPTPTDTPAPTFPATGTVWPPYAALLGLCVVKSDPTNPANQYIGNIIQPGPGWIIEFCNLPAATTMILYVFASDGIDTGFASVEFTTA